MYITLYIILNLRYSLDKCSYFYSGTHSQRITLFYLNLVFGLSTVRRAKQSPYSSYSIKFEVENM